MRSTIRTVVATMALTVGACSNSGTPASGVAGSSGTGAGGLGGSGGAGGSSSDGVGGAGGATTVADCTAATTNIDRVVCASEAFLATLTDAQRATVEYAFTDAVAKTRWSNLPGVTRNGLRMGDLSATSQAAALALMQVALTTGGYSDLTGVMAADDYLGTMTTGMGNGPPGMGGTSSGGATYSSGNYMIAFIGTPSSTGNWMLQFGGHHMAYNITYLAGVGYPVPNHIGVEPKAAFTINGGTYQPLADEQSAVAAIFAGLSADQLASAYLAGQTFADVLLGPDEYATGSYSSVVFPTGASRTGVLVSSLTADQQALVTAAIAAWVQDFDPAVAAALLAAYTSASAYADTYVAWGGTQAAGPDPDVSGTYFRIDGPRVWIEVACQSGVVITGKTHLHTIYRDKAEDYGASL